MRQIILQTFPARLLRTVQAFSGKHTVYEAFLKHLAYKSFCILYVAFSYLHLPFYLSKQKYYRFLTLFGRTVAAVFPYLSLVAV